jgi:hypothetical protein
MCTQISFLTFVSSQASRQTNWRTGELAATNWRRRTGSDELANWQTGRRTGELANWQANWQTGELAGGLTDELAD